MPQSLPKVLETIAAFRDWRRAAQGRIGFVPTMGALHEGHAELLRQARQSCDRVVLSIFVNPTQFGPNEDFEKYPKTLDSDLLVAAQADVDAVFLPSAAMMYPSGFSTFVEEETESKGMCGDYRPGHFRGVTTVVLKLLNVVAPHRAFFGLKDAQQFLVLSKMVDDLNMNVEMIGVPTVREPDGLAMSSRNRYLAPELRTIAPLLYQTLVHTKDRLAQVGSAAEALDWGRQTLNRAGFRVQYFELRSLPQNRTLLAIAAHLGSTRLIDNLIF